MQCAVQRLCKLDAAQFQELWQQLVKHKLVQTVYSGGQPYKLKLMVHEWQFCAAFARNRIMQSGCYESLFQMLRLERLAKIEERQKAARKQHLKNWRYT